MREQQTQKLPMNRHNETETFTFFFTLKFNLDLNFFDTMKEN